MDKKTPVFFIKRKDFIEKYDFLIKNIKNSLAYYSFKTNNNISLINELKKKNGRIVVSSIDEFKIVKKLFPLNKIIFHSVMSKESEIKYLLENRPFCIFINNYNEFLYFNKLSSRYNRKINIGLQIDITNIHTTNSKINKFGIHKNQIKTIISMLNKNKYLNLLSFAGHLGTNILEPIKYKILIEYLVSLSPIDIKYINIGGGFPSLFSMKENNLHIKDYIYNINNANIDNKKIIIEPGRFMIEDSAYIKTTILGVFHNYIIVDIGTNFLIPLDSANYYVPSSKKGNAFFIVGRLCHSSDIIASNVILDNPKPGDIIKIFNCGAYTYSLKNNFSYNDPCVKLIK